MSPGGRAIIDLAGPEPTEEELRRLMRPCVAGVIFFTRNYVHADQVRRVASELNALRPELLLCVDHEGGRVQRFRDGFTGIPAMRRIGELWDTNPAEAASTARAAGLVIASELSDCGLDFSFAPVLDLDYGVSEVIGNRAFHSQAGAVAELAGRFVTGLAEGGMAAVGKHFPGHGFVRADSHLEIPVDDRPLDAILREDLVPYRPLIQAGLAGVMPAHVIYPSADPLPAGFSRFWLKDVLRGQLAFDGVIFSDDLSMEGAAGIGDLQRRASVALEAGCDGVLLCNAPAKQEELLEVLERIPATGTGGRLTEMKRRGSTANDQDYRAALALLDRLA